MAEPGKRIGPALAAELFQHAPLGELMAKAYQARMRLHPEGYVTYVLDTNPNFTNICVTGCRFCAFWRSPKAEDAFTLSPEELAGRVLIAAEKGATTVLMQGGLNPEIRLIQWIAYIRAIRRRVPEIHIHPFSPPEIIFMAEQEGCSTREILKALRKEGIRTVPGGGAEILVDRVRQVISPKKCGRDQWLALMEEAHELGFSSTATMMYGHVETEAEILEHLFEIRSIQDRTRGFSAFVPWSFKPGNTPLGETVTRSAHPALYLRILATARLVLDNVKHIQSSWFSESKDAGALALLGGADDFGGILLEEHVLKTTGHAPSTTEEQIHQLIRQCGFTPARRNSDYETVEICNR